MDRSMDTEGIPQVCKNTLRTGHGQSDVVRHPAIQGNPGHGRPFRPYCRCHRSTPAVHRSYDNPPGSGNPQAPVVSVPTADFKGRGRQRSANRRNAGSSSPPHIYCPGKNVGIVGKGDIHLTGVTGLQTHILFYLSYMQALSEELQHNL